MDFNSGYLELFLGCMFSGKTTELINIYKKNIYIGKKVAVLNYVGDTRYHTAMLSNHDKIMIDCIAIHTLSEIWNDESHLKYLELRESDVVLINEGQFFPDLHLVLEMVETYNKKVYICGLDGDFKRQKFGQMLDLIPYCDKVSKLRSLCSECKNGNKGVFSFRSTEETSQVVIGSDNYKPLCRNCYKSKISNN